MLESSVLSEQKKIALMDCAKWAKYLGIITIASVVISFVNSMSAASSGLGVAGMLALSVVGGSFSIANAVLLLSFQKHANNATKTGDVHSLERALFNFKWYFGLMGIILIIAFSFMCLAMGVGIISGLA